MNILCGTAGWTDKTLIACKRFYPRGCSSAEARLRYYASCFPLVEVDSSFYGMPSASNSRLWAERTPEGFTFNFKAFRLLTGHQTPREALSADIAAAIPDSDKKNLYYRDLPADVLDELWRRYREALDPLRRTGRLGAVLFQFAPWLTSAPEGVAHVEECARRMHGDLVAVEFRNSSWLDDRHLNSTLAMLKIHGLVHVVMDAPADVKNRAQTVWVVTNPALTLVRLHGRNATTWNATGATSASVRFDYDYGNDELTTLAGSIRNIASHVDRTHVIFNNCFEDQGQRNATTLIEILAGGR
ncbi:DUF72 domain-containing protein [Burkholderia sp. MSMB1826]|uniref:DUF72 domain-containing protein n=1 Tax=Burkholderia sp. MSMB1826 TaxID=1637875 RepID=UPI00075E6E92|nr:DUF72 domain-containing protein [Burkholderia sp. MSMB1826]KVL19467.1 hypothetical protein WS95_13415 [Burkholderia sp. MSMB1826]